MTASIGLILPNATALALADHGHRAGSALALLGALQYVVGAVVAPLVGIAGTGTALPMAIVIATLSLGAGASYVALARPAPAGAGRPGRRARLAIRSALSTRDLLARPQDLVLQGEADPLGDPLRRTLPGR